MKPRGRGCVNLAQAVLAELERMSENFTSFAKKKYPPRQMTTDNSTNDNWSQIATACAARSLLRGENFQEKPLEPE